MPSPARLKTPLQLTGLACGACHAPDRDLKRCTGCCAMYYCSPACQRDDWESHADLCAALSQLPPSPPADRRAPTDPRDVHSSITAQVAAVGVALGRRPRPEECDVLWMGRRCAHCLASPRALAAGGRPEADAVVCSGTGGGFTPCPTCLMVMCCSEECWGHHRAVHRAVCRRAQAAALSAGIAHSVGVQNGGERGVPLFLPGPRVDRQEPLPAEGWTTYIAGRRGRSSTLSSGGHLAGVGGGSSGAAGVAAGTFSHLTDGLSRPLTVLRALERLIPRRALVERETLIVHVLVGKGEETGGAVAEARASTACAAAADGEDYAPAAADISIDADSETPWELEADHLWEEVVHQLPRLRLLHVVYVGPCLGSCVERRCALGAAKGDLSQHTRTLIVDCAAEGGSGAPITTSSTNADPLPCTSSQQIRDRAATHRGLSLPSTAANTTTIGIVSWDAPRCLDCRSVGAVRRITLVPAAYHDWVAAEEEAAAAATAAAAGLTPLSKPTPVVVPSPELVALYYPRLYDPIRFPGWTGPLTLILERGLPLLLTASSVTRARRDWEALRIIASSVSGPGSTTVASATRTMGGHLPARGGTSTNRGAFGGPGTQGQLVGGGVGEEDDARPLLAPGCTVGEDNPYASLLWTVGVADGEEARRRCTTVSSSDGHMHAHGVVIAVRGAYSGGTEAAVDGAAQRQRLLLSRLLTSSASGADLEPAYAPGNFFSVTAVTTLVKGLVASG